ncbi:MAG: 1-acyl-sn-glycerol-3-phosphate acyltransferase [Oscillospiraceae bacterium]|nr:1-acyl-sn-glycerol-3-phosphate acyltransferase [Oscillospiraceae bacterium]
MTAAKRFYRRAYALAAFLFGLFFRLEFIGRENIPSGAAVVCTNHSDWLDSVFLELALGKDDKAHIMGKKELLKIPLLSWFVRKMEMIPVDRSVSDTAAIRLSLGYLKSGAKVAIFPEGHRVSDGESSDARNGAVWLAVRAGAPVLPMYIPRKKPIFGRIRLVIGEPYAADGGEGGKRLRSDDYGRLAAGLMDKINALSGADRGGRA